MCKPPFTNVVTYELIITGGETIHTIQQTNKNKLRYKQQQQQGLQIDSLFTC